ncbi:MAG TPA: protein kinase [Candidatus Dormibacteraeota bacterium]|nr:protein kinase [Candidatus Dormibacteraeota bacterium]
MSGGIPQVGAEFAGYRIERLLGRGGVGIVYLALDLRLQRRVALKILATELSSDERVRARFAREPRLAASIDHPNIIPIYEAGEAEGNLYIAMRHVDGCDLGVLVRREAPLDAARVVTIVGQVGSALDAAHARGLFHRDIKPANILVVPRLDEDSADHAYVADFGITKNSSTRSLTKTGQYVGTLDYVAPEQIRGESVDATTDIYALGCVLYESLTGIPPFQKDNDAASIYAHLAEDPPRLSVRRPDIPPALDEIVITAMAKDRERRYASGAEMAAAARRALGSPPTASTTVARPQRRAAPTVVARPAAGTDTGPTLLVPIPPEVAATPAPKVTGDAETVVPAARAASTPAETVVPAASPAAGPPAATPRPAPSVTRTVARRKREPTTARPVAAVPAPPPQLQLDYRVLGPLEVRDADRPVTLGSARQRSLLARLLLDASMVVSTERLIDALWSESAMPEDAEKSLQTLVAGLRRVLEPGLGRTEPRILVAREPGYLLRVDADDVDLVRFERLLEQGRRLRRATPERSAEVLREALSLWRGPALEGVRLEGAARSEVRRLEDLRLACLEERIDADLALGRHAELVDELGALVEVHPERSRMRDQLAEVRLRTAEPESPAEETPAAPVPPPPPAPRRRTTAASGARSAARPTPVPAPPPAAKVPTGAPPPVATPGEAATAPGDPRRRRVAPVLAGAAGLLIAVGAGTGLLLHSRHTATRTPATTAIVGTFPTAAEKRLQALFPPFVQGCHRYANHYEKTIAEVECSPTADHPGAKTIVYQQFSNYADLEEHFHHVLALNIQTEVGKPFGSAFSGACSDPNSGYFALSTYPIADVERQDTAASPTAHGHLMCYIGTRDTPKLAWTNTGQLVVAQAVGTAAGPQGQSDLLTLWEFAGPTGSPDATPGSAEQQVKGLYQTYLQREPENADALNFWVDFLNNNGFAKTANAFADSSEAKTRFTLPFVHGGAHGGSTPAPTPTP